MRHNRGMTLVELIVATAVAGAILMATMQVMFASQDAIAAATLEADIAAHATNVMDKIANDLKEAIISSVTPITARNTYKGMSISFRKCLGWDTSTGTAIQGPIITIEFYVDPVRKSCCIRRTDASNPGVSEILTDRLAKDFDVGSDCYTSLQFGGDNDTATTAELAANPAIHHYTKFSIFFIMQWPGSTLRIARQTHVQLKF
jgi:prepilin-type N-terminal cleavage/methylation domain-containing protein